MSQVIENKVVSMEFDNKNFQRGVGETLSLLGKLQQALNLTKSAKSMYELGDASKKLDFSKLQNLDLTPITKGIEALTDRFSTLGIIGMTVIQRLTNGVIDFVTNGINRAVSGGMKRALNIEQAEFTLKGLDADVSAVRDNAMAAVKGTAFGLDEAFKAASMFTASGVKAGEEMEQALTGISGVAAMTSSSYSDIANVFTNVAGSGYMMGDAILSLATRGLNAAAAMSKYYETVKGIKYTEQEIREMAGKRQIEAKDFFAAMNYLYGEQAKKANDTYTGALSNVQAALSRIGAAFTTPYIKNMREVFIGLIDVLDDVGAMLTPLEKLYERAFGRVKDFTVGALSGIDKFLKEFTKFDDEGHFNWDAFGQFSDQIKQIVNNIMSMKTAIRAGLIDIFNKLKPSTEDVTRGFHKFLSIIVTVTDKLKWIVWSIRDLIFSFDELKQAAAENDVGVYDSFNHAFGEKSGKNVHDTMRGIASAIRLIIKGVKSLLSSASPLIGVAKTVMDLVFSITGAIGRYITKLEQLVDEHRVFQHVAFTISKVLQTLRDVITYVSEGIQGVFNSAGKGKALDNVANAWENNAERLEKAKSLLFTVLDAIGNAVKGIVQGLSDAFKTGDFQPMLDLVNGGVLAAIGMAIKNFIDTMADGAEKMGAQNMKEGMLGTLDALQGTLEGFQNSLKANVLIKIAIAVGILAASLVMLAAVDPKRLTSALAAISAVMFALFKEMDALAGIFEGKDPAKTVSFVKMGLAIDLLAVGILILASAVKKLAGLNFGEIVKGLAGIFGMMIAIAVGLDQISMVENADKIISKAAAIVVLSIAIRILAESVKVMGDLDPLSLTKGLIGVIALLMAICALFDQFDPSVGVRTGIAILAISAAMLVLSKSVEIFAEMDSNKLIKGVGVLALVLAEIAAFSALMGESNHVIKSAVAVGILAASMKPLIQAILLLGNLSDKTLWKGLISMASGLTMLSVALLAAKDSSLKSAANIIIVAAAVLVFAKAMQEVNKLNPKQMLLALGYLSAGMVLLVGALNLANGSLTGAAAMLVISVAVTVLANALKKLGEMKVGEIVKALLTLAVAFVEIAAASLLFTVLAVPLAIMSAVLLALGVALLAAGVGVSAFAAGLKLLGELGASGVDGIVKTLEGISAALPTILENLALAIIGMLQVFYENIPTFIELGIAMIMALLQGIRDNIGEIITIVADIIIIFIDTLGQKVGEIINAGVELVVNTINGLADAIYGNAGNIVGAIDRLVGSILYLALEALKRGAEHLDPTGWLASKIAEWQDGIVAEFDLNKMEDAGASLVEATDEGAAAAVNSSSLEETGRTAGGHYASGVNSKADDAKRASSYLASESAVGATHDGGGHYAAGQYAGEGFISGLNSKLAAVRAKAAEMAGISASAAKAKLLIQSPSRVFMEIGGYVGEGFAIGIEHMADRVAGASVGVADGAISAASSLTRRLASRMESADFQPTIRPVLDLTNVEEGAGAVNGLFSGMSIGASIDKVEALSASIDSNQNGSTQVTDMMNQMLYKMNDMQKAFANGAVDPNLVYEAVYAGSSQATPNIRLNNRELNRELRSMGVAYR